LREEKLPPQWRKLATVIITVNSKRCKFILAMDMREEKPITVVVFLSLKQCNLSHNMIR
jgi:hypothetical protein